jgi:integral membrane sensor domain MASE1
MAKNFTIDLTEANQLIIATTTSDGSVTVPAVVPSINVKSRWGSWYIISIISDVTGALPFAPTYLNFDAAATTSCAAYATGVVDGGPFYLPPGTVVHAKTSQAAGIVTLTPVTINYQS